MTAQTTLTDLTDDETAPNGDEETASSSRTDEQPPTRSTLIDPPANPALDAWIAERTADDEPYGYCHLYLVTHSDLSGSTHDLRYETQIDLGAVADTSTTSTGRTGWGGVGPDTVQAWLIDWMLTILATPYHEELRAIPGAHLRIFVADNAHEYLSEQEIAIDTVCEQLHGLAEHRPSDTYLTHHRTYTALREWLRGDDGLLAHERRIEATIRARLGFTTRYGSQIPDPDSAYETYSLSELQTCLETVREQSTQTTQRCDELSNALATARTQWRERTQTALFE